MQRVLGLALIFFFVFSGFLAVATDADAYVRVKGYYRKDGTYVQPYVRSNPNGLKYDNYSWTPSQGLYNDTYGTRGSDWDTPTWSTDPQYYEGKALYDSGSSGSLGNFSYTLPTVQAPKQLISSTLYRGLTNSEVTASIMGSATPFVFALCRRV